MAVRLAAVMLKLEPGEATQKSNVLSPVRWSMGK
jgi:hypothetical protein